MKLTGGVHKVVEEKLTDTEQFKENKNGKITDNKCRQKQSCLL
jgi:hypothetical protein